MSKAGGDPFARKAWRDPARDRQDHPSRPVNDHQREVRCFWSWPLGHVWGKGLRTTEMICLNCGAKKASRMRNIRQAEKVVRHHAKR